MKSFKNHIEEAYRKPTQAEIDADKKKENAGKKRPSMDHKSAKKSVYKNMMGGLKKEEVELDEAATPQMKKAAASIEAYAKKHGGIDKADFMKAAKMLSSGNAGSNFIKFVDDLDTEPREWLITNLAKTMGKQTVEKMFKVKIREEVELDESRAEAVSYHKKMSSYHDNMHKELKADGFEKEAQQHAKARNLHFQAEKQHKDFHKDSKKATKRANDHTDAANQSSKGYERDGKKYDHMSSKRFHEEVELTEADIAEILHQYALSENVNADQLAELTEEEINEIIGKAVGGAFKLGAKAVVGAGRMAKKAVVNKQGNIRGTRAARQDAAGNRAEKEARKKEAEYKRKKRISDMKKRASDLDKKISDLSSDKPATT